MTTVISGDTGVSQIQNGSVTQSKLAANVVGNGPAFSAWQNVSQSVTSAGVNLVFGTEEYDTNNDYNNATGVFTASVAGYYYFNAALVITGASGQITLSLRKSGADVKTIANVLSATGQTAYGCCDVYLGVGETVQIRATSATTQNSSASSLATYFQGHLARAA